MSTRFIGKSLERVEDSRLLRGQGRYVDDMRLPGMLHACFVRSTQAHARVLQIDTAAALGAPGVRAVFTAKDFGVLGQKRMAMPFPDPRIQLSKTQYPLALDEVCYVGEAVAVVIAEDRYAAEDGAALVEVEYEPLSVVSDCRKALDAQTGIAHSGEQSNLVGTIEARFGDVDKAFDEAAVVLREHIDMHRGGGHSMECRGVVAMAEPGNDGLQVWTSTQSPHAARRLIAAHLGWDEPRVRVITPDVGGGFGPKAVFYPEELVLPMLALRLGVPVKWIEDRREHFVSTTQQREQIWDIEIAAAADGKILALRGRAVHDNGAYLPYGLVLAQSSLWPFPGPYAMPALNLAIDVVFTNMVPTSPVRGAGRPYAAFVIERCIDSVAQKLRLDPAEVRRVNFVREDQFPYATGMLYRDGSKTTYDSGNFDECLQQAVKLSRYDDFDSRRQASARQGRLRGIGMASYVEDTGLGPFEGVTVRVLPTGMVQVLTGAAGQGQGHATILAQICADRLGVSPEWVSVISGDTGRFPYGLGTIGSRIAVTAGSSAFQAAGEVAQKALRFAALQLKVEASTLSLSDGFVLDASGARTARLALGDIARALAGIPGVPLPGGLDPGLESTAYASISGPATASGTHIAEVEVDPATGAVVILDYVVAHDCGKMLNPLLVEGQVIGGVVHGIGNAFFERMVYDNAGQPLSTNYGEFLLPTATEIPAIRIAHVETSSPLNPLGAKGAGESGTIPAAAALIGAVENALREFNVKISRHPISPQDIVEFIELGKAQGACE